MPEIGKLKIKEGDTLYWVLRNGACKTGKVEKTPGPQQETISIRDYDTGRLNLVKRSRLNFQ